MLHPELLCLLGGAGLHTLSEQGTCLEQQGGSQAHKANTELRTGLGQQVRVKPVIRCQMKGGFSPLPTLRRDNTHLTSLTEWGCSAFCPSEGPPRSGSKARQGWEIWPQAAQPTSSVGKQISSRRSSSQPSTCLLTTTRPVQDAQVFINKGWCLQMKVPE